MLALAGVLQPSSLVASRRRRSAVALVVALLAYLMAPPCRADPLPGSDSFEARFAPVGAAAETSAAPGIRQDAGENAEAKSGPAALPAPLAPASSSMPDGRDRYRALIEREARSAGLAPEIAEAVMAVESGYNPGAIGGAGEIGLMQIMPPTARLLGFGGTLADLAVPETNIHYGVMYLAQAWRLAGEDLCTAVMKYRAGHGETRFSYLSVNYCQAVRSKLFARGFRVTGNVPVATFGEATSRVAGCGRKCLGGGGRLGTVNIASLNMRLADLVVQARRGH